MREIRRILSLVVCCQLGWLGCGGAEGTSPEIRLGARQGRLGLVQTPYVPAAQTCPALPPPAPLRSPIASTPTHVSGYVVCGSFTATAETASFNCPLPAGAIGPYRLLLYNGNPDGSARAHSATVLLNGNALLGPKDFDEKIGAAAALAPLASANTLVVALHERRAVVRLQIVDEGQTCSILRRTLVSTSNSPVSSRFTSTNAFAIPEFQLFNGVPTGTKGVAKGAVSLNSQGLVSRNQFQEKMSSSLSPVQVLPANLLTASADAPRGTQRQYSVQVVDRDNTPPAFMIAAPADASYTNQPLLRVGGSIDDPSARISIAGVASAISQSVYGADVALKECWNVISVHAVDACGNASDAAVRAGLDTVPPVLVIQTPGDGSVTNQRSLPIQLRYSDNFSGADPTSLRLTMDGGDMTPSLSIGSDAATGTLSLSEGAHILSARISDRAGNVTQSQSRILADFTPPTLAFSNPKNGALAIRASEQVVLVYADALSGVDLSSLVIALDGTAITDRFSAGPRQAVANLTLPVGAHTLQASLADRAGNAAQTTSAFTIASALPPDPSTIAPPLDRTVATSLLDSTAFLYSGPNPIQVGVAAGTIDGQRVSVIRGLVRTRSQPGAPSTPIPGVHVSILGHPEFGSTLSRNDGYFDLAVNGGGPLTIAYSKSGYLPSQREVQATWRTFTLAPDVALIPYDPSNPTVTPVTIIQTGASSGQMATGPTITDRAGTRTARIVFPQGTHATATLTDGTQVPLTQLTVSATEYTVGVDGKGGHARVATSHEPIHVCSGPAGR